VRGYRRLETWALRRPKKSKDDDRQPRHRRSGREPR
jgi:hypothetical protein